MAKNSSYLFFVLFFLGCFNFILAQTSCVFLDAGDDIILDCNTTCVDLTAEYIGVPNTNTSTYVIAEPSCPLQPISGGSPSNLTIDDRWSNVINLPFDFIFYQNTYNQIVVSANGQVSFNTSLANQPSGYEIDPGDLLPTIGNIDEPFQFNTIYGALHDMNPNINPSPDKINYLITGSAPNRAFVLNFDNVRHFGTFCTNFFTTQQIILYESSNVVEVNLIDKPACTSFNGGLATLGIQGNNLTEFSVPPGRNTGVWSVTNESYRFVPDGPEDPNTTFVWTDPSGAVVGTGPQINVCPPPGVTVYMVTMSFQLPNGSTHTFTDTVEVTQSSTPIITMFDQVAPVCQGDPSPLLTTSTNGVTGTWSPVFDSSFVGFITYTFTPDAGQCATEVMMTVEVTNGNTPVFNSIPTEVCVDDVNPLPNISDNSITGTWSPSFNSSTPNTTLYTFTPDAGQCAIEFMITIEVTNGITPVFNSVPAELCVDDPNPLPNVSEDGITGMWAPAFDSSVIGVTPYTFTPDTGQCAMEVMITIEITDEIIPTFDLIPPICLNDPNPLPLVSNNNITGSWSPVFDSSTLGNTTYTFTPDAGQCATITTISIEVTEEIIPTFDPILPLCIGDTSPLPTNSTNGFTGTWSPVFDSSVIGITPYTFTPDAGQCATEAMITIEVLDITLPTFTQINPICEGDILDPLPTISLEGITGLWSPAINNTVTTIYTFAPDSGQCATTTTMTIEVSSGDPATFEQVPLICEGDVLDPLPTTSLEGVTGTWTPAINNTITTTYTFTPDAGQCASIAFMTIEVIQRETPLFDELEPVCQGLPIDDLPTISTNGVTGTWTPAINNTVTTTYTFTPNEDECATEVTLEIEILEGAVANLPQPFRICDNDEFINDGLGIFDLEDLTNPDVVVLRNEILGAQSEPEYTLTFHESLTEAEVGSPVLIFPFANSIVQQVIYARVTNTVTDCFALTEMALQVDYLPVIEFEETYRICVDDFNQIINEEFGSSSPPLLDTGLDSDVFNFVWTFNDEVLPQFNSVITALLPGTFAVTATNIESGCEATYETEVIYSSPPFEFDATVSTDAFAGNHIVEATVTGIGDYLFQIDDEMAQESSIFTNVAAGLHYITIYDAYGCGSVTLEVSIIDFPKYVTPNNDGYNDNWNIIGLAGGDPGAKVYIFDKFGKLLKQISPLSNGWDGTYNGDPLPSSDYWFLVEYTENSTPKEFRGHFTLKR